MENGRLQSAIRLNSKYGLAYRNRGSVKLMKGDINGALAYFNHGESFDTAVALVPLRGAKAKCGLA